jgi:hypothetical protein
MRSSSPMLLILPALAACASPPARAPGETDARCIHRLYDYPTRSVPFQTAANQCSGGGPVDLTGDRYYQLLASTLNVPYVTRDPKRDGTIVVTGSRLAQPTDRPVSPEVRLR